MRAVHQAEDVELDHPLPLLDGSVLDGSEQHDAGVVDQGVQPTELGDGALDRVPRLRFRVTSTSSTRARPPPASIRRASSSSRSRRRAASATVAPSAARASAVASPMPELAPVISAVVPSSRRVIPSACRTRRRGCRGPARPRESDLTAPRTHLVPVRRGRGEADWGSTSPLMGTSWAPHGHAAVT